MNRYDRTLYDRLEELDRELLGYLGRRRARAQYELTSEQWAIALLGIVGGLSTYVDGIALAESTRR